MTDRRDLRSLAARFVRRHNRDIAVLDADRLAAGLQRYLPEDAHDPEALLALRSIVIDVASQSFIPTRWGLSRPDGPGRTAGRPRH